MATDGFLPLTHMQSELVWPLRRPRALHPGNWRQPGGTARGSGLGARQQTRFELRRDHLPGAPDPDEVVGAPTHCPTCRSQNLTTTSKVVNAESYWRCEACGEVWNVARLRAGSRYAAYRPFGR